VSGTKIGNIAPTDLFIQETILEGKIGPSGRSTNILRDVFPLKYRFVPPMDSLKLGWLRYILAEKLSKFTAHLAVNFKKALLLYAEKKTG